MGSEAVHCDWWTWWCCVHLGLFVPIVTIVGRPRAALSSTVCDRRSGPLCMFSIVWSCSCMLLLKLSSMCRRATYPEHFNCAHLRTVSWKKKAVLVVKMRWLYHFFLVVGDVWHKCFLLSHQNCTWTMLAVTTCTT